VAAWVFDNSVKPQHGKVFKRWGEQATKIYPQFEVTTLHSFPAHAPFHYYCGGCKKDIQLNKTPAVVKQKVCKACRGKLTYIGKMSTTTGKLQKPRAKTRYNLYVQENYQAVKDSENLSPRATLKKVAGQWEQVKAYWKPSSAA